MVNHNSTSIVLIHGLWLTPRSWESFRTFYEERRYKVLTPAWPRMLIAGSKDNQVPVSMIRENFKRYARSTAITDFKKFLRRSHLIAIQDGWQEVAEYALSWVERQTERIALRKAA